VTSRDDEQSTQVIPRGSAPVANGDGGDSAGSTTPGPIERGRKSIGEHLSRVADGGAETAPTHGRTDAAPAAAEPGTDLETTPARDVATTPPVSKHSKPTAPPKAPRPRRARLTASRVDPWSVMKMAFMLSIAWGIMTIVAVLVVWNVLNASGVFDSINSTVSDVLGAASTTKFDINQYVGFQKVAGFTTLICVVDVVLMTALATLGAFLYNLSASLLGGIEVTLAEEE